MVRNEFLAPILSTASLLKIQQAGRIKIVNINKAKFRMSASSGDKVV
jgi:hypothetical protein